MMDRAWPYPDEITGTNLAWLQNWGWSVTHSSFSRKPFLPSYHISPRQWPTAVLLCEVQLDIRIPPLGLQRESLTVMALVLVLLNSGWEKWELKEGYQASLSEAASLTLRDLICIESPK